MAARRQAVHSTHSRKQSSAAQAASHKAFEPAKTSDTPSQRLYRIDDARHWLHAEAASFNRELGKIFRETGIALQPCPVLSLSARGCLTLSNHHPDAERIRSLCRHDPTLKQRFIGLTHTARLVREAEDYPEYARRYEALAHDPRARQALVKEAAAKQRRLVFQLAIGVDGPALFFTEGHLSWASDT